MSTSLEGDSDMEDLFGVSDAEDEDDEVSSIDEQGALAIDDAEPAYAVQPVAPLASGWDPALMAIIFRQHRFANREIPDPPPQISPPSGPLDVSMIHLMRGWPGLTDGAIVQMSTGVFRRPYDRSAEGLLEDAAQEFFLRGLRVRRKKGPNWEPEGPMMHPIEGSMIYPGSIERPHPALLNLVANERRKAQRRLLDALNTQMWPRILSGMYGEHTNLINTQYMDYPSIFQGVLPAPFFGGQLLDDVMRIVLYGKGNVNILNHFAGLDDQFPRSPIETWKLGALCVHWLVNKAAGIKLVFRSQAMMAVLNGYGAAIYARFLDEAGFMGLKALEDHWLLHRVR